MESLSKFIFDAETGESQIVPFTTDEVKSHLAEQKRIADEETAMKQKIEVDAAKRIALLEKLGITEDEARLLLGGN